MTTRIDLSVPAEPLPSEPEATNIALELLQLIDGLSQACPGRRLSIEPELIYLLAQRAAYRGTGAQLIGVVQRALKQGALDRAEDEAATALSRSTSV